MGGSNSRRQANAGGHKSNSGTKAGDGCHLVVRWESLDRATLVIDAVDWMSPASADMVEGPIGVVTREMSLFRWRVAPGPGLGNRDRKGAKWVN
jgi:hypothetical protein